MDNEPLSQQADSSPYKSGEQLPKAPPRVKGAAREAVLSTPQSFGQLPSKGEQLPKAPPRVKGAAKGTVLSTPQSFGQLP